MNQTRLPIAYPRWSRWGALGALLIANLVGHGVSSVAAQTNTPYCQQLPKDIAQKNQLRQAAIAGDRKAQQQYKALLSQHAKRLSQCRTKTWPRSQALWIRLYPCDAKPGVLEAVLDRIVDRGYNQVYVETFYSGQVLLPANANPTPWPSVMAGSGADNVDLLSQAIRKGRERGLKVYSWLFSMNFGAEYARQVGKQAAIARNGLGQTSSTASTVAGLGVELGVTNTDEVFIDPYHPQARQDYAAMVRAVAQRKPDGMLFDYIRYPRGYGSASVAGKVQDLWIYGNASRQTLLQRAANYRGMELIQRFMNKGYITAEDLDATKALYPKESEPLWQGRSPSKGFAKLPAAQQVGKLQVDLWQLAVSHAAQGVLDFLVAIATPLQRQGIPTGAVFFPEGNMTVGQQGFDSRLQPWDRFPKAMEWHPMAYSVCGNSNCIMAQIQRVLQYAPRSTQVKPVLAGVWQQSAGNRPPLEQQMQALYRMAPSVQSVSHFAYSWQEPGSDRDRKYCRP